jgi:hypothetical protein
LPILLPACQPEGLLLMLRAFFDDSGSHASSEIVTIGGLVGTPEQWTNFDKKWKALPAEPLPGKPRCFENFISATAIHKKTNSKDIATRNATP